MLQPLKLLVLVISCNFICVKHCSEELPINFYLEGLICLLHFNIQYISFTHLLCVILTSILQSDTSITSSCIHVMRNWRVWLQIPDISEWRTQTMVEVHLQLEHCIIDIHTVSFVSFHVYLHQLFIVMGKLFCAMIYTYYRVYFMLVLRWLLCLWICN